MAVRVKEQVGHLAVIFINLLCLARHSGPAFVYVWKFALRFTVPVSRCARWQRCWPPRRSGLCFSPANLASSPGMENAALSVHLERECWRNAALLRPSALSVWTVSIVLLLLLCMQLKMNRVIKSKLQSKFLWCWLIYHYLVKCLFFALG